MSPVDPSTEITTSAAAQNDKGDDAAKQVYGAGANQPAGATDSPVRAPSRWPGEISGLIRDLGRWVSRPRVRLTLAGLGLLVIAGLVGTGSAWTAPLLVVGTVMVLIAWVGPRLRGRLVMDWGDSGAKFELRAEIRPTEHRVKLAASASSTSTPAGPLATRVFELESKDADVIEAEARTIEIDVAQLKALIAVAESSEAQVAPASANGSSSSTQASDS